MKPFTKKTVVAKSHGAYRGVNIYETNNGYSVILKGHQYDFISLTETTAFIDAVYAPVLVTEINRAN